MNQNRDNDENNLNDSINARQSGAGQAAATRVNLG